MKIVSVRVVMLLIVCVCFFGLVNQASAIPMLAQGGNSYLGRIQPGLPDDEATYLDCINRLIDMDKGSTGTDTGDAHNFIRSMSFEVNSLLDAVGDDSNFYTGGRVNNSMSLGDTPTYTYVLARYGSANGCALVWCVRGMSGEFSVQGSVDSYGDVKKVFLFKSSVPDGGSAVALLGMALMAIASVRGKLAK